MRNFAKYAIPAVIVVVAVFLVSYLSDSGDIRRYTSFSAGEGGTALLSDTLRHMGHNVRVSYSPLSTDTPTDAIYIIIQPQTGISRDTPEEIMQWVRDGGRLVYLCRSHPNSPINRAVDIDARRSEVGGFIHYRVGYGEILSGRASPVTNYLMMNNAYQGYLLEMMLSRWQEERPASAVFFAEYYQGFSVRPTFIGQLPLILRLIFFQIALVTLAGLIFFGKRFGNPIPYYEETEREENEYIHALARLYMQTDRKRKK